MPAAPRKPAAKARKAPAKAAAPRKRAAKKPAPTIDPAWGTNRIAAEATVSALRQSARLDNTDTARITTFLALADAVDEHSDNASLWREYRAAELALREVKDDQADAFAQLVAGLSS